MKRHVCPWWVGYLLVSPIRRWIHNPEKILAPYISEGMIVLDIGPGMGFFTIPAARLVGESGTVIAVDIQKKILKALVKRAERAGIANRIITKLCEPNSLGTFAPIDLCLAFNVMHEVPDAASLFLEVREILKPTGRLLLAEPGGWRGRVSKKSFESTLTKAAAAGLKLIGQPKIRSSRSALFLKG